MCPAHCTPQRTALTDDDIRAEVAALERLGHRRLLCLTGEHPKYTFDQFLHVSVCSRACSTDRQCACRSCPCKQGSLPRQPPHTQHCGLAPLLQALHVINSVQTEPCGNIRRVNVEIPSLSVSDIRRLKATNCVSKQTRCCSARLRTICWALPWPAGSDGLKSRPHMCLMAAAYACMSVSCAGMNCRPVHLLVVAGCRASAHITLFNSKTITISTIIHFCTLSCDIFCPYPIPSTHTPPAPPAPCTCMCIRWGPSHCSRRLITAQRLPKCT